jgi:hypothetical protein
VGQSAKDSVKAASDDLRRLKGDAEGEMAGAVADARTLAAQARSPLAGSMQVAPAAPAPATAAAARIAPVPQPAPAPTIARRVPVRATRDQVKDAMNRAEAYLLATQATLERDSAAPVLVATDGALGLVTRVLDAAVQRAVAKLVSPLSSLQSKLAALIENPTRLFDPSTMVDEQVTAVQSQVGDVMAALSDEATRDATTSLDGARPALEHLQQGAASMRAIADAMATLARYGNEDVLRALTDLLPPLPGAPPGSARALAVEAVPSVLLEVQSRRAMISTALAQTLTAKTHATAAANRSTLDLGSQWARVKALQATPPAVSAENRAKVAGDFDKMFRGATRAQVDAKKDELVAGARKHFKGDPATLRKVEDLIRQQAAQAAR